MSASIGNNFVVYRSSAGSGKTFTLVKEYLKLAFKNKSDLTKSYKSILAITFTNKAAAEMKWRIITALKEISSGEKTILGEKVCAEMNISYEDMQERAEIVLTEILHHYSDFSIGTIDSFTNRIIRTFAMDLQLPVNFQIETDTASVYNKIIANLIGNLGRDATLTNYLLQFSLSQLEEEKSWDPEGNLLSFISKIHQEGTNHLVGQLKEFAIEDFDKVRIQLESNKKTYERTLIQYGQTAISLIESQQLSVEHFYNSGRGIYNLFRKLLTPSTETTISELMNNYVKTTLNEDKWASGKATPTDIENIESIKDALRNIVEQVVQYIKEHKSQYDFCVILYKNIYAIGLVNELSKLIDLYKEEENILFISEFNEKISDVVSKEPTPYIYERLGERFQHFLLDEFQDTSSLQWQNILPLIDNSLASNHMNLIVGDGKQSIYRWRNANVEQFAALPMVEHADTDIIIKERQDTLIRNYKPDILKVNRRSDSQIVIFNNKLFQALSEKVLVGNQCKIYDNQEQEHNHNDKGYVSIEFPIPDNDMDRESINNVLTLQHIKDAINDGYAYNDICVIVRTNKNGNSVANYLIENNIPVVSADSLLLKYAKEVEVIISFLKYLTNQKDMVSAAVVVNYLKVIQLINEDQCILFTKSLSAKSNRKSLFDILAECRIPCNINKLLTANVFDVCLEIIMILKLNKANSQYIRFFIDDVLTFLQTNTSNLLEFLDWWNRQSEKSSVIIPEGINAVNIMTIHGSKGLEFPIVIAPYLEWELFKPQSVWVELNQPDMQIPVAMIETTAITENTIFGEVTAKEKQQSIMDNLNLLYVCFTRAVHRLHIISPKPPKKRSSNSCYNWMYEYATSLDAAVSEKLFIDFGSKCLKENEKSPKKGMEQLAISGLEFNIENSAIKIKESSAYQYTEGIEKAREKGVFIHYILSQIKTIDDLEDVLQKTVLLGDITEQEYIELKASISQLISRDELLPYFQKGVEVKNEFEILSKDGIILRPDRVVIKLHEAVIIDYKTGKRNQKRYHAQMSDYQKALEQLGYSSIKKILVYIQENEIEICP